MNKAIALLLLLVSFAAKAEIPDPKWVVGDSIGQAYVLLPDTVSGSNPITIQFHFFTSPQARPSLFQITVAGCDEGRGTVMFTRGNTLVKSSDWEAAGEQVSDALAAGACRAAQERIS